MYVQMECHFNIFIFDQIITMLCKDYLHKVIHTRKAHSLNQCRMKKGIFLFS